MLIKDLLTKETLAKLNSLKKELKANESKKGK